MYSIMNECNLLGDNERINVKFSNINNGPRKRYKIVESFRPFRNLLNCTENFTFAKAYDTSIELNIQWDTTTVYIWYTNKHTMYITIFLVAPFNNITVLSLHIRKSPNLR